MKTTNSKIEQLLQARADLEYKVFVPDQPDGFWAMRFKLNGGSLSNPVIIHALPLQGGPGLRICALNAAIFPSVEQAKHFCRIMNEKAGTRGKFFSKPNAGMVGYVSEHLLGAPCPSKPLFDRIIRQALKALADCSRAAKTLRRTAALLNMLKAKLPPNLNPAVN